MSKAGPTSTAVRASRRNAASALDFFPTPPWAVRALVGEVLRPQLGAPMSAMSVWEPACGAGHCAIPLAETFGRAFATDVHDWGYGAVRDLDFSFCGPGEAPWPVDWVITNPPFTLAAMFARRGLAIARRGVALLLRLQWLEGGERYHQFFAPGAPHRASRIVVFAERVPMIEGAWDPEASSATAYCWVIWDKRDVPRGPGIPTVHLPPGMADAYTRPADEALAMRGEAARRRARRTAEVA